MFSLARYVPGVLALAALALALLYQGADPTFLGLSQAILVLWLTWTVARTGGEGLEVPRTPCAVLLTLFWLWLGLSVLWSRVPYLSVLELWTVGSLPLLFWLYLLAPHRERLWRTALPGLAALGLGLAALACYQRFVLGERPTSLFLHPHAHTAFLNLLALALAGRFLAGLGERVRPRDWLAGAVVSILFFAIALGAGRGPTLGFALGLAALALISAPGLSRRRRALVPAVALAAFVAANLTVPGTVAGQLDWWPDQAALAAVKIEPASRAVEAAGEAAPAPSPSPNRRILLWRSTLAMLRDAPWYGIGGGTYWLALPPYRFPQEDTDGFYAHNDYLQALVELGWPGLLLVLGSMGATGRMLWRGFRRSEVSGAARAEIGGLAGGLLAVAFHSLFTFNFHILATLSLSGLFLGRLHHLCTPPGEAHWVVRRPAAVGPRAGGLAVCLVALIPLTYLAGVASTEHFYGRGVREIAQGRFEAAAQSLGRAGRLLAADRPRLRLGVLYTDLLQAAGPDLRDDARRGLYQSAAHALGEARRINPLRSEVRAAQGRLYRVAGALAGSDWRSRAEAAYRDAIALNPRFLGARRALADLLVEERRELEARDLLTEGLRVAPPTTTAAMLPYYALVVRLHLSAGDEGGAAQAFAAMRRAAGPQGLTQGTLERLGLGDWLAVLRRLHT